MQVSKVYITEKDITKLLLEKGANLKKDFKGYYVCPAHIQPQKIDLNNSNNNMSRIIWNEGEWLGGVDLYFDQYDVVQVETTYKVIIAGGRDFNNYELLCQKVDSILSKKLNTEIIEIVSGMANGADTLGVEYAKKRFLTYSEKPADWVKYGKAAGFKRNAEMASYANACICFWDGKSKGTKHMIDLAKKHNLDLRIIRY